MALKAGTNQESRPCGVKGNVRLEFVPKIHQSVHLLHIEALILVGDQYRVLGSADVVGPKPDDVLVLLGPLPEELVPGQELGVLEEEVVVETLVPQTVEVLLVESLYLSDQVRLGVGHHGTQGTLGLLCKDEITGLVTTSNTHRYNLNCSQC